MKKIFLGILIFLSFSAFFFGNIINIKNGENIQDFIDRAESGDIIYLNNGNYRGNISVNKPLRIIGSSKENVIISADSFEIYNTDDVIIENITLTSDGTAMNIIDAGIFINNIDINTKYNGISVFTYNNNVSINNVKINGTKELSGKTYLIKGYGIKVMNYTDVYIQNSHFSAFSNAIIAFSDNGSDINIIGNDFSDNVNSILLSGNMTSNVFNNSFLLSINNSILLGGNQQVNILGNIFYDNAYAVFLADQNCGCTNREFSGSVYGNNNFIYKGKKSNNVLKDLFSN